eukprot:28427-Rhodomonas_salina.1
MPEAESRTTAMTTRDHAGYVLCIIIAPEAWPWYSHQSNDLGYDPCNRVTYLGRINGVTPRGATSPQQIKRV